MAAFIYLCPVTGIRVQVRETGRTLEIEKDTPTRKKYIAVECVMCRKMHHVDPETGKVLSEDTPP